MNQPRLTPDAALQALAEDPQGLPFRSLFRHGSLEVEVYKPGERDLQTPHARDEVYVVIAGNGEFTCASPGRALTGSSSVPSSTSRGSIGSGFMSVIAVPVFFLRHRPGHRTGPRWRSRR